MGSGQEARDNALARYRAGTVQRLVRPPVPVLTLVAAIVVYLIMNGEQPSYYLFFLPVALTGVGLGARRGVMAALTAVVVVGIHAFIAGRQYLTGETPVPFAPVGAFASWAVLLALTGYTIGLVSERGGSRAVGRDLGTEIMGAVEREHVRIGYDLHDTLAQNAASSLMEAEILTTMIPDTQPDVREQARRLRDSLDSSIDQIRTMIAHLRPPSLSREEFLGTLHDLVDGFGERTGVKIEYSVDGSPERHSDSMRICVYRVVQEALANCERHAHASRVFVSLRATRNTVFLLVTDDGVGFDDRSLDGDDPLGHYGLQAMRERVSLLGGTLVIETAPGHGTGVRAQIPAL